MEKYQRLEKPIENIASTVFVYKKGEVVYKGSYQKWKEIDEKEYIKNLKENEKPIVEFVVDERFNAMLNDGRVFIE